MVTLRHWYITIWYQLSLSLKVITAKRIADNKFRCRRARRTNYLLRWWPELPKSCLSTYKKKKKQAHGRDTSHIVYPAVRHWLYIKINCHICVRSYISLEDSSTDLADDIFVVLVIASARFVWKETIWKSTGKIVNR